MDDNAWIECLLKAPSNDHLTRLAYADWLEERGHPGADYLRTEAALARAAPDEANTLRRKLLDVIPRLPSAWRDRFEQPDLLLAPPVPFATGWFSENATAPRPYRSLPNLDAEMLTPEMPWPSGEGTRDWVDQAEHEAEELDALEEVQSRAQRLNLALPPGFVSFARDFRRRTAVEAPGFYCQVCLQAAFVAESRRAGDGHLIHFFSEMNYGNPHQLLWSLYLVPGVAWHCVVAYALPDGDPEGLPDPELIYYCAPSFQAFLYRWWLEHRGSGPRAVHVGFT